MDKFETQSDLENKGFATIKELIHERSTIDQLDFLARADQLFKDRGGRYYGGILTEEEVKLLDPPKQIKSKDKKLE